MSGRVLSLAKGTAFFGAAAADVLLDRKERRNAFERLRGDPREAPDSEFVELSPHVRPTCIRVALERRMDVT